MLPFSDDELFQPVSNVIEKLKKQLALDGGGIKFLKVKNGIVYVQLQGACIGCSSSSQTLKYGVERTLKLEIHPDIEVINIPPGQEDKIEE